MSPHRPLCRATCLLVITVVFTGCAATTHLALASGPLLPQHRVLELQIARVTIQHEHLYDTLNKLDHEIRRQSAEKLVLPYAWGVGTPNPEVNLTAHDISLRSLLDELCRQSGAFYELGAPGMRPPGLYFSEVPAWQRRLAQ